MIRGLRHEPLRLQAARAFPADHREPRAVAPLRGTLLAALATVS